MKKNIFKTLILLPFIFWGLGCQPPAKVKNKKKPKNIILLIGDGMGLTQVSTSFYFNENPSNFARFKHIGFINTSSSSHKITDSAAGATAFSTGKKSYNGAIGIDSDKNSHPTILEMSADRGMATGVIATSSITHATPASFYAHNESRNNHEEIAADLVASKVDFFAGGGYDFFGKRKDSVDYIAKLKEAGFQVNTESLEAPESFDIANRYGWLLSPDGMPRMLDGRGDFLPQSTQMSLDHLSQKPEGFFLMVEGSQIDWGGHANNADYIITEVIDFDETIGKALDFAEADGETLVIVTADHETGGFALSSTPDGENGSDYNKITGTFSTGGHTTTLIPVFAFGPGSENFNGIYQNTGIFDKMVKSIGWK